MLAVGQEKMGITNPSLIKAMGAFGGGIASTGNVCGALLGGVAFVSSLYSKASIEEQDNPLMWRLSYKLAKLFEDKTAVHGGINCKDIAALNWKDKEAVKDFYANPESRRRHCIQLVGDVAFALGELLEQAEAGKKG
ncbi:MAG: C-GCAxxG-C-C family protein [Syntrophobacteraceae bacterium]